MSDLIDFFLLQNIPHQKPLQEKRKLLWGAKKDIPCNTTTRNSWETVQFSNDTNGAVASKFLRLMGMKNTQPVKQSADSNANAATIEKRDQMFNTMERQFETARQVTHKMRGKGLGSGGPVAQKKYF